MFMSQDSKISDYGVYFRISLNKNIIISLLQSNIYSNDYEISFDISGYSVKLLDGRKLKEYDLKYKSNKAKNEFKVLKSNNWKSIYSIELPINTQQINGKRYTHRNILQILTNTKFDFKILYIKTVFYNSSGIKYTNCAYWMIKQINHNKQETKCYVMHKKPPHNIIDTMIDYVHI